MTLEFSTNGVLVGMHGEHPTMIADFVQNRGEMPIP